MNIKLTKLNLTKKEILMKLFHQNIGLVRMQVEEPEEEEIGDILVLLLGVVLQTEILHHYHHHLYHRQQLLRHPQHQFSFLEQLRLLQLHLHLIAMSPPQNHKMCSNISPRGIGRARSTELIVLSEPSETWLKVLMGPPASNLVRLEERNLG